MRRASSHTVFLILFVSACLLLCGASKPRPTPASASVNAPSAAPAAQFFYFAGTGNTLSGLSVSDNTVTTIPGSPFTIVSQGQAFSMAAGKGLLFTDCYCSPYAIVEWTVDSATGALSQASSTSESSSLTVVADPTHKFLYGFGDSLYGYSINQSNGQLTPLSGSPYSPNPTVGPPAQISPDGAWICGPLFAGPGTPGAISCAKRDPSTGAILTGCKNQVYGGGGAYEGDGPFVKGNYPLANILTGGSSGDGYSATGIAVLNKLSSRKIEQLTGITGVDGAMVVDPSGTLVAVVNGNNSTVTLLSFDPTTTTLTQAAQITLPQNAGAPAFSCDGNYLAVADSSDNTVSVYSVANDGLAEISGSPIAIAAGSFSQGLAVCPAK
ncbi:MAG TPA: hypothetical protein VMD76_03020 [Candidatus Sulfotelmatobacter sp.]|nr:hypothetical protein [Candidatus Sulfotelmatobacter sp.]